MSSNPGPIVWDDSGAPVDQPPVRWFPDWAKFVAIGVLAPLLLPIVGGLYFVITDAMTQPDPSNSLDGLLGQLGASLLILALPPLVPGAAFLIRRGGKVLFALTVVPAVVVLLLLGTILLPFGA